jgi:SAM-dependent methyltransferase
MKKQPKTFKKENTSWEPVGKWYQSIVGEEGHYYHRQVILPALLKSMKLQETEDASLLDLACGQGVLARHIPENIPYTGVGLSPTLIRNAKTQDRAANHIYHLADITTPLPLSARNFSHASIVLALQNTEFPDRVLKNAFLHLRPGGHLFVVLNHPCFRIPRQSSWRVDEEQKTQYRRIDRYSTSLKVPINSNPSQGEKSSKTWSFHHPLSAYSRWIKEAGLYIEELEEWYSDKVSVGKAAKMENRSREEIPLFLCITAYKPQTN